MIGSGGPIKTAPRDLAHGKSGKTGVCVIPAAGHFSRANPGHFSRVPKPFGGLHVSRSTQVGDAFIPCGSLHQAFSPLAPVRGILTPNPIRVCVSRWHFTERPEKAFGWTLKVGFVEIGGDRHADSLTDLAIACWDFRCGSLEQGSGSVQDN